MIYNKYCNLTFLKKLFLSVVDFWQAKQKSLACSLFRKNYCLVSPARNSTENLESDTWKSDIYLRIKSLI